VLSFQEMARQIGPQQPLYGLEPRGLDGRQAPHTRIESMAAAYLEEIKSVQPAGPYFLAGHCMGGLVAFEMAQQLRAGGDEVGLLALFETAGRETGPRRMLDRISRRVAVEHANLAPLSSGDRLVYVAAKVGAVIGRARAVAARRLGRLEESDPNLRNLARAHSQASRAYVPRPYQGSILVFWAQRPLARRFVDPTFGWGDLAPRGLEVRPIRVPEGSLIQNPEAARAIAAELAPRLRGR
jgi:thioesterase domain-containing protein